MAAPCSPSQTRAPTRARTCSAWPYLIFWALRSRKLNRTRCLARLVDGLFLIALTGLVLVGFVMVYALF